MRFRPQRGLIPTVESIALILPSRGFRKRFGGSSSSAAKALCDFAVSRYLGAPVVLGPLLSIQEIGRALVGVGKVISLRLWQLLCLVGHSRFHYGLREDLPIARSGMGTTTSRAMGIPQSSWTFLLDDVGSMDQIGHVRSSHVRFYPNCFLCIEWRVRGAPVEAWNKEVH